MKIIQVAEALAVGDAIANDVVEIDKMLRSQGRSGGIYVQNADNIAPRYLHTIAETTKDFPDVEPEDLVLLHHGIANDFVYTFASLRCRRVLVYHNITPPEFFEGRSEGLRGALIRGLEQVRYLADKVDYAIADSEFNRQNLLDMGYTCPIYVCPVLIPFDDYKREPDRELMERYNDGRTNILFVGRISPHKKQEDILRVFYLYKRYHDPGARLFLVGGGDADSFARLHAMVKELRLEDVYITGSVPFPQILAYYRLAHALCCMSEHEGFCIPLIEAMYFDVPVLAYGCTAIPFTLGGSGVIVGAKDFARCAAELYSMVHDKTRREEILRGQRKRLDDFAYKKVAAETSALLDKAAEIPFISNQSHAEALLRSVPAPEGHFDVVITIKASDWSIAQKALPFIERNIQPGRIIFLSSRELKSQLPEDPRYIFICEDELLDGMTFKKIRAFLQTEFSAPEDTGWYLQQFLKLGYALVTDAAYYLVWDADTLPVRPISFFNAAGQPLLNKKREYVKAYFDTIRRLFGFEKGSEESYITEHMLFKTDVVREMLGEIAGNAVLRGGSFWEKCLYAADRSERTRSFSEFETYGTYLEQRHPGLYAERRLETLRPGVEFLGRDPGAEVLEWAGRDFDSISFEAWGEPIAESVALCSDPRVRRKRSFAQVVKSVCADLKKRTAEAGKTGDWQVCAAYRALQPKLEFDFFFSDVLMYNMQPQPRLFYPAYDGLHIAGNARRDGCSILLEQGGIQFGPYVTLPAGTWCVELEGTMLENANIDCVCWPDCSPLTLMPLEMTEKEKLVFRLILPETRRAVELRCHNLSGTTVVVKSLRFVKESEH